MSIFKSAFTVSFYISLSRIFGFIRDLVIAKYLGVSLLSDVFFAAFRLPNFFRRVFAEGAFNSAFVPIFVDRVQDKESSDDEKIFARNIFSLLLYVLLIFVLVLQLFMPFFMKILFPGFHENPEKFSALVDLSRITIFYLIFISLVALCSSILNSINKFAVPAASPIILNSTLILSVLIFGSHAKSYAHALSWGVFTAGILQFLWLMFFTMKSGFILYPKIPDFGVYVKKFMRKFLPGIIGANVMQINLLVDSIFASITAGAVSYLYYADRINQLPLAMIGIAIGIALLPTLSRKIKEGKHQEALKLQNLALEVGLLLVMPATVALTVLSYPIISTLFERGNFTATESFYVAKALMFYSFGLPSYVLVKVMEPAFFARGNTSTPMKIAFICLINNVVMNLIFYKMKMGYVGIILASVSSTYLNLSLLTFLLSKKSHFHLEKGFFKKVLIIIINSLLMATVLYFLNDYFDRSDMLHKIIELIIMITVGLTSYLTLSYFTGSLKLLLTSLRLKKKK